MSNQVKQLDTPAPFKKSLVSFYKAPGILSPSHQRATVELAIPDSFRSSSLQPIKTAVSREKSPSSWF